MGRLVFGRVKQGEPGRVVSHRGPDAAACGSMWCTCAPGLTSPQIGPNVSIPVDAGALTMTTTNTRRGSQASRRPPGEPTEMQ
jgi:hypothetical protein